MILNSFRQRSTLNSLQVRESNFKLSAVLFFYVLLLLLCVYLAYFMKSIIVYYHLTVNVRCAI